MTQPQEFDIHAAIRELADTALFVALRTSRHGVTLGCQPRCKGWTPEPDVRVACWEVFKRLPNRIKQAIANNPYYAADNPPYPRETWEGVVLYAAVVWMKEVANA